MDPDAIAGTWIMIICCWGCGALFLGTGIWANCRKRPMHFWAGTKIDPDSVSDIPAYNRENGRMWMLYSIPYWIAGVFSLFIGNAQWCAVAALGLILLACFPGLLILIRQYQRIEKKYIQSA